MRKLGTCLFNAASRSLSPYHLQCQSKKLTSNHVLVFLRCVHQSSINQQRPPWNYDRLSNWGYDENNGPATWPENFPEGQGRQQSPIDIQTDRVQYDPTLANNPLRFSYGVCRGASVENTGRSLKININQKSEVTGGPLKDTYHFEQFHLHWGSKNDKGSEHTINGKLYAAEWHSVHWNLKYGNFLEAAYHPDGLSVVTYMVQVGAEHQEFKKLTDVCSRIINANSSVTLEEPFDTAKLLQNDISAYWTYPGSLTTPPLLESVTWIIFRDPVEISQEQMDALRKLKFPEGQCMVDNYRPPTPLHQRTVRASFRES
ncbi:carbonic anhydrase 2-like [Crassostrea virginica]